jgi:hypothetical protein
MSGSGTVELWAIDFNIGSFDNCTDSESLLYTFTDVAPPVRDDSQYDSSSDLEWYNGTFWYYNSETGEYEDQDDYGDEIHRWEPGLRSAAKVFTMADADAAGFVQIPIFVWDECGNNDFCIVNLRLVDNMGVGEGRIAGTITTEFNASIGGVMTEIMSNSPEFPAYSMTNDLGEYAFDNLPFYYDYFISASKDGDLLNGVSTLDLVFIQKHILGQKMLDSPYKMIAADINNDNEITALDLIELRKVILGISGAFPNNNSWKIVKADNTLSVDNPWIASEVINITDFSGDMIDQDLYGVKIGDVNSSVIVNANANANGNVELQSVVNLNYEDTFVHAGDLVELHMTNTTENLFGYQFTMDIAGFELVEIIGSEIKEENVGFFNDQITMSFNTDKAIHLNDKVFTMVLRAKEEGQVSEMLGMNSHITKAEAYVGQNLEIFDIQLNNQNENLSFRLYQNQPNPFRDYTVIGFDLKEATPYTLSLYDVTGKTLKVIDAQGSAGYNEVNITKAALGVSGLVYYTLETDTHTATRHMILIE